ncbi:MAG: aminodeoxychorismate synthase component I [Gemmataceae bacterium]
MSSVAKQAEFFPLVEEATGLEPWEACRRLADRPHLIFFDSARLLEHLGRYSFVATDPIAWLTSRHGQVRKNGKRLAETNPFDVLQAESARFRRASLPGLPPFQGGIAGLFGYGLGRHIERLPQSAIDEFRVPDLAVGIYDWVIAFDHLERRSWIISHGLSGSTRSERLRAAKERIDQVRTWLDRPHPPLSELSDDAIELRTPMKPTPVRPDVFSNFDAASYRDMVRRGIEYVHAGDCFQVNLSQRLVRRFRESPLALYERLRQRNAAPFAGYFDLGDFAIASASPERFLRLEADGGVETRPIKGTRPRSDDLAIDVARAEELRKSAKDRAENVMIVDLLRNDLGRVCKYGSVRVEALCRLESYRYVHHLVSEVRGQLKPGCDAVYLLRATFPGGSVTGAPKIRAMEIIAELEQVERGPYCGSLGWIGFDGAMDTNLLIRTFVLGKGWMHFAVGGGIVADSDPGREYEETWHKAEGLLRAIDA